MHTTGFDFDVITGPSTPRNDSAAANAADPRTDPPSADRAAKNEGDRQR